MKVDVDVALNPKTFDPDKYGEKLRVRGYPCQVLGIPMVVHRPIIHGTLGELGAPGLSRTGWTVTEPRTGLRIVSSQEVGGKPVVQSRQEVIEWAETVAKNKGGVQAIRNAIKEKTS